MTPRLSALSIDRRARALTAAEIVETLLEPPASGSRTWIVRSVTPLPL